MSAADQTYDFVCFTDLVYEFSHTDKKKIEQKIKRRLKYHKLGAYDQEKVEYIRRLKDELQKDLSDTANSTYYHRSGTGYAELSDFDTGKMTDDFHRGYNKINKDELKAMIDFAVYIYHLR
ncbi:MAG: hypothetical protein ACJ77K_18825 [Bacteroidia bacterium]